jgi:hypothetical protein
MFGINVEMQQRKVKQKELPMCSESSNQVKINSRQGALINYKKNKKKDKFHQELYKKK